jgi:hypothetical protein
MRVPVTRVMMAFRTGEQMDLFGHHDRVSERRVREDAGRIEDRPDWMRDGAKAALLEGDCDLEVVGESFYQDNLWRLAAARPGEPVRVEVIAVLVAEDGNPYDSNAIAVWIDGRKVGHLSRENARVYRSGLLALQRAHRMPIALTGVIVGGGLSQTARQQIDQHDTASEAGTVLLARPSASVPGYPRTPHDRCIGPITA